MLAERLLVQHEPIKHGLDLAWLKGLQRSSRKTAIDRDYQLLDAISILVVLVQNSAPVPVAISWLAPRLRGVVGKAFQGLDSDLRLGADHRAALDEFAAQLGGPLARELAEKVSLSLERGTQLSGSLRELSDSYSAQLAAELIAKVGGSETKMLIPTVFLILPVSVLFAVYPSLSLLQSAI